MSRRNFFIGEKHKNTKTQKHVKRVQKVQKSEKHVKRVKKKPPFISFGKSPHLDGRGNCIF
jgi:hypothetical protein